MEVARAGTDAQKSKERSQIVVQNVRRRGHDAFDRTPFQEVRDQNLDGRGRRRGANRSITAAK